MLQGLLGSKERVVSEVRQKQLWKSEEIRNASLYSQHHKWFRYW